MFQPAPVQVFLFFSLLLDSCCVKDSVLQSEDLNNIILWSVQEKCDKHHPTSLLKNSHLRPSRPERLYQIKSPKHIFSFYLNNKSARGLGNKHFNSFLIDFNSFFKMVSHILLRNTKRVIYDVQSGIPGSVFFYVLMRNYLYTKITTEASFYHRTIALMPTSGEICNFIQKE